MLLAVLAVTLAALLLNSYLAPPQHAASALCLSQDQLARAIGIALRQPALLREADEYAAEVSEDVWNYLEIHSEEGDALRCHDVPGSLSFWSVVGYLLLATLCYALFKAYRGVKAVTSGLKNNGGAAFSANTFSTSGGNAAGLEQMMRAMGMMPPGASMPANGASRAPHATIEEVTEDDADVDVD